MPRACVGTLPRDVTPNCSRDWVLCVLVARWSGCRGRGAVRGTGKGVDADGKQEHLRRALSRLGLLVPGRTYASAGNASTGGPLPRASVAFPARHAPSSPTRSGRCPPAPTSQASSDARRSVPPVPTCMSSLPCDISIMRALPPWIMPDTLPTARPAKRKMSGMSRLPEETRQERLTTRRGKDVGRISGLCAVGSYLAWFRPQVQRHRHGIGNNRCPAGWTHVDALVFAQSGGRPFRRLIHTLVADSLRYDCQPYL